MRIRSDPARGLEVEGIVAPIAGMRVQGGIVGYDDGFFWNEHGGGTDFQGLRTRAGGLGDCDGGVETYGLELAGECQMTSTRDPGESLTTTAKQRGRRGNTAS